MKLDDMSEYPAGTDGAQRVREAIRAMGLTDGVAYRDVDEEGGSTYWVVTNAGLCVGQVKPPADYKDRGEVTTKLVAWSKVRGASMTAAGFSRGSGGMTIDAWIDEPEFRKTVGPEGDQKALADFIVAVMRRQRRD